MAQKNKKSGQLAKIFIIPILIVLLVSASFFTIINGITSIITSVVTAVINFHINPIGEIIKQTRHNY